MTKSSRTGTLPQRRKLTSAQLLFPTWHNVVTTLTTTLRQRCHNMTVPAGRNGTFSNMYYWPFEYVTGGVLFLIKLMNVCSRPATCYFFEELRPSLTDPTFYPKCWMKCWIKVREMFDESLYRLYVSSNICHSFIWCQIKDIGGHAFASDTIRAGLLAFSFSDIFNFLFCIFVFFPFLFSSFR